MEVASVLKPGVGRVMVLGISDVELKPVWSDNAMMW